MFRTARALAVALVLLACGSRDGFAADKFFYSNFVRLRYVEKGSGEAVVLLHGNGSWIEDSWGDPGVIDALATTYRVIALDFRGYGRSDKPHDPAEYGARMAEDVIRLLDHLHVQRAHVVGYSMGARITSWLIVNRPGRLITATLGASTYWVDTPEQRQSFKAQAKAVLAGLDPDRLRQDNPGGIDADATPTARGELRHDPLAVAAAQAGTPGLFITEAALAATKVPILHIIGSLDVTRLEASRHFKDEVLPSAEFVIVEGATHGGPTALFCHPEFVLAVREFIARHRLVP
jgi:pimeloyl-ACP methyl ester carboxylesterase